MTLSRRSFFTKLAGAAVAGIAAPHLSEAIPVFTSGGSGIVGFGSGSLTSLHGAESVISLQQAAQWFDVPAELIGGPSPTFTHARVETEAYAAVLRRQGL